MTKDIITCFFTLTVLVCLLGCSSGSDQEIVNQQYVDSEEYDHFAKQADREQEDARQRKRGIKAQLQNIGDCSAPRTLSVPFKIDSLTLAQWKGDNPDSCFEERSFKEYPYTLEIIGETSFQNTEVIWILRSRRSVYRDQELLVATIKDQELRNAEKVAQYRKNLEEDISTDVEVSDQGDKLVIATVEHRNIKYPIEQKNSIKMMYSIDNKGIIVN